MSIRSSSIVNEFYASHRIQYIFHLHNVVAVDYRNRSANVMFFRYNNLKEVEANANSRKALVGIRRYRRVIIPMYVNIKVLGYYPKVAMHLYEFLQEIEYDSNLPSITMESLRKKYHRLKNKENQTNLLFL